MGLKDDLIFQEESYSKYTAKIITEYILNIVLRQ